MPTLIKYLLVPLLALLGGTCFLHGQAGTVDSTFNPGLTGGSTFVSAIAMQPDGKMLISGFFKSVAGTGHGILVRLNGDGTVDSTFNAVFNTTTTPSQSVQCLALQPDGKILIGGTFLTVNGQSRVRIARLLSDGTLDSAFNSSAAANDEVSALAVQPDGNILVAGWFSTFNGQSRAKLARLNSDGSLESTTTFNTGTGPNDWVEAMALQPDGKIVIAGFFSSVNGQTRNRLARLLSNGSVESITTFNPGTGPDTTMRCLAIQPDGKIIVGGNFDGFNGQGRGRVARLNTDGTLESTATFDTTTGAVGSSNPVVYALALQADGKILVGGSFTNFNGPLFTNVARLNPNGTVESSATFNPGTGPNALVQCLGQQSDGRILVGGQFSSFNVTLYQSIARLNNDAGTQVLNTPGPTRLQWLRSGALPEVSAVTFELSTNAGASWSPLGSGARVAGGWSLTGLNLPAAGLVRARGRTAAGYGGNSSGIIQQTAPLAFVTLAPTLTTPVNGTVSGATFSLGYNLPEDALNGSAKVAFNDGINSRILTLAAAGQTAGTHSLTFSTLNPLASGLFTNAVAIPEGNYSVTLSYQDADGNPAASSLAVTNVTVDATAPILALPAPVVVEAQGPGGAPATYQVTASDNFDPNPALVIAPASGSNFAIGTTQVSVSATDQAGNVRTGSFSVTVSDTTPPAVGGTFAPLTIQTGATGTAPLPNFVPKVVATDAVGVTSIVQNPAAGSLQSAGTTVVTITATDTAGNPRSLDLTVTVEDGTAPTIGAPAGGFVPLQLAATGTGTAPLPDFRGQALTHDNVGVTAIAQNPAPGTAAAPGTSMVTLTASDAAGNTASLNFNVNVVDLTSPTIAAPVGDFAPKAFDTGVNGTAPLPDYRAQAVTGDNVGVTNVVQDPAPGTEEAAGAVLVTLTVYDAAQNTAQFSFTVTVNDATKPEISAPASGFIPLSLATGADGTVALPDYTAQPVSSDNVGVVRITQNPASGSHQTAGVTTVTLTAFDAANNSRDVTFAVTVLDGTAPALSAPDSGFFPLSLITGAAGTSPLPDYTPQAVTVDNVAVASVIQDPVAGSARRAGTTTVTLSARDAANNVTTFSFSVAVADGTNPTIAAPTAGFTPQTLVADENGFAPLPDYTPEAVTSDNVGVTSVTQTPGPGDTRPFGKTTITLTAHDDAGNTSQLTFDVLVTLAKPLRQTMAASGGAVPGAGVDPRVPAGASFTSFGLPAIDEQKNVAFLGRWSSSAGAGTGIFFGEPPALLAKVGEEAAGLSPAKWKTLEDPLLAPGGTLVFRGTVQGGTTKASENQGVWMLTSTGLHLILQEGHQVPGAPAGIGLKSVSSMSLRDDGLVATVAFLPARGLVTSSDDIAVIRVDENGGTLLLRENGPIDLPDGPATVVKTFQTLIPAAGSGASGRWHADGNLLARVALGDTRTLALQLPADGSPVSRLGVGEAAPDAGATAYWSSLGLPAIETSGHAVALQGVLKADSRNPAEAITAKNNAAVAYSAQAGTAFSIIARKGGTVPLIDLARFTKFLDPLVNNRGDLALVGTFSGPGVTAKNNTGLWSGSPGSLPLIARLGDPAPDAQGLAGAPIWSRFVSVALPDESGPVFLAALSGKGVTARSNMGLWATDSGGTLREVIRTGDLVDGNPVVAIHALGNVAGSLAASRGFNSKGTLAARLMFARGKQQIVRFHVPDGVDPSDVTP